jgi:ABC-2 type transport system permease protein
MKKYSKGAFGFGKSRSIYYRYRNRTAGFEDVFWRLPKEEPMRWPRIKSVILHASHHLTHSMETWMDIFWFPMIQAFVFGGVAIYFSKTSGQATGMFVVMGIILWYAMEAGSYSITVGTLWEVWAKSFSSLFVSPLTIEEFIAGHMIFGLFKQIATVIVLSIVGNLTFHFSILSVGVTLPIHLLILIEFGNASGMFILCMIHRYGTRLQSLAVRYLHHPAGCRSVLFDINFA